MTVTAVSWKSQKIARTGIWCHDYSSIMSELQSILIFADGASRGNPGPAGWGAIVVMLDGRVREIGGRQVPATNNQMELQATIQALRLVRDEPGPVSLWTDSVYVIKGITQWIWAWRNRGWKTAEGADVQNADLWQELFREVAKRGKENPISWNHVRGHSGVPGNERADELAVEFALGKRPALYSGPLLQYSVAIYDLPENGGALPAPKPKQAPKPAAYSYLSLVGNTAKRHKTWAECERRVKGVPGAKFKKTTSASNEAEILGTWGVPRSQWPDDSDR